MGGMVEELEGFPNRGHLNYEAERPRHEVQLSAFLIDKYEVTNAHYRRFLEAIKAGGSSAYDHPDQPPDANHLQQYVTPELLADDQPAVGLNWFDAYAYCKWAGKRMPTEAEWEYAARGPGQEYRKYPWGSSDPDADGIWRANYRSERGADADGHRLSAPVGSYPEGISPFGVMDLAGNAEEWVADWLDYNYYRRPEAAKDPQGPAQGHKRVVKGGSYGTDRYHIRIATRLYGDPRDKSELQGCRCARNP
jgi:formylglycine-generating enzyme required for sulfatase activity